MLSLSPDFTFSLLISQWWLVFFWRHTLEPCHGPNSLSSQDNWEWGVRSREKNLTAKIHPLLLALNCPLFLFPLHFQISLYFRGFPLCSAILYLDRKIRNTKISRAEIENALYECLYVCRSEHEMILKVMVKPMYFVIFCQALLVLDKILPLILIRKPYAATTANV